LVIFDCGEVFRFTYRPSEEFFACVKQWKGSSLLVWSSGRGLVQVLNSLTYVKQWGE